MPRSKPVPAAEPSSPPWYDTRIVGPEKTDLPVRIYGERPAGRSAPLVVHFHGGAYVAGGLDRGMAVAQLLADAGAVVVSVDYPVAPAHPFPAAIEAGHAALSWAFRQRTRLAGNGAALFVAGEEAGGNLAAAMSLVARDRLGPALAGQILLSPMLDPCVATESLRKADAGPMGCRWADGWRDYLPNIADCEHPYAVPGHTMRLTGLPPTLLITSSDDPMRDETRAFAERVRDKGGDAKLIALPIATGWPCSFAESDVRNTAWALPLTAQFQTFFQTAQARVSASAVGHPSVR
jgi:acetyl esterase/lipase